jgi:hypothetical protein
MAHEKKKSIKKGKQEQELGSLEGLESLFFFCFSFILIVFSLDWFSIQKQSLLYRSVCKGVETLSIELSINKVALKNKKKGRGEEACETLKWRRRRGEKVTS